MPSYPNPIPLAWYYDDRLANFTKPAFGSVQYCGSSLMVPEDGDFAATPYNMYEDLIVNNTGSYTKLSNRCRHKRSMIVDPIHRNDRALGNTGPQRRIMCPVHCWTYDLAGKNINTPHFDTLLDEVASGGPGNAGLRHPIDLPAEPLQEWNGFLFTKGDRNIAEEMKGFGKSGLFDPALLDMSQYRFYDWEVTDYNFNWLVFMDVYFDLYHVAPYHDRTFSQLVDTRSMEWEFGDSYSMQVTKFKSSHQGVTAAYGYVRTLIEELYKGEEPPHGALWFSLYPNMMIEWYPLMTMVSTIIPTGPNTCRNVVEYYLPRKFERRGVEIFRASQAAYNETAVEDGEICLTMSDGYYRDFLAGIDERGPDHPFLELGIVEFHKWLRSRAAAYPQLIALDKLRDIQIPAG